MMPLVLSTNVRQQWVNGYKFAFIMKKVYFYRKFYKEKFCTKH